MKALRVFVLVLLTAAVVAAIAGWRKVSALTVENQRLQIELQAAKAEAAGSNDAASKQRDVELQRLRAEVQDVARLRNEVTRLNAGAKETEKLRSEVQRLREENQRARASANTPATPTPSAEAAAQNALPKDSFPRESWTFAGYASPDAALVSAIWAMREGNPKTYFDSLSPEEQARITRSWENKSAAEIAAKHQADVSQITGMRILERQDLSPNETVMSVYIDGVQRTEKVSMKRIGNDWKFGGFIREPQK